MKVKKDYVVGGCYIWRDDATTNSCYDRSSVASSIMDLKEIKSHNRVTFLLNQEYIPFELPLILLIKILTTLTTSNGQYEAGPLNRNWVKLIFITFPAVV